jgi:hypothetical protein
MEGYAEKLTNSREIRISFSLAPLVGKEGG